MKVLEERQDPRVGEELVFATSESGVRIAVARKPGFSTAAGSFGVRFGSTDTRFEDPEGRRHEVPEGSAHFLEHKLFEGREEKVFDRFGRLGARFNGGTGFFTTNYFFVSAGRFEECLEVLLDFVQHPRITEERVEKEKGIIEQEVRMYEDDPGYRGLFLLHRALYHRHPVRVPPGGTVESVRATTAADLQACYDAFYRPHQLRLVLAGDLDPEAVLARVEALLDPPRPGEPRRLLPEEPPGPARERVEETGPVQEPRIWLGWKEAQGPGLGRPLLERRILSSLVLELALGTASERHEELYTRGVVDDSFQTWYGSDASYGYALAAGQTPDPEAFEEGVRSAVARFLEEGVEPGDLERVRRAAWGALVSGLQTPAALASRVLSSMLDEHGPFEVLDVLEAVTPEALEQRAAELLAPERTATAVLRPAEGG